MAVRRALKIAGYSLGFFLLLIVLLVVITVIGFLRQSGSGTESSETVAQFTAARESGGSATIPGSVAVTSDDPSIGPLDAAVTVVEFSDFECPFCKQAFPIIRELSLQYGDRVRFLYRDFPVASIHPNALKAAEAGECAHAQGKFWPMHDRIFQNAPRITVSDLKRYARTVGLDGAQFDRCLDSGQFAQEVEQDLRDGVALGVRGTPTWFINGHKVEGVIPRETFITILDQLLVQSAQKSP